MKKACFYEILLKQDTPLIHFQCQEPGAILRGSEVKPKLDKFILKWMQEAKAEAVPENWYIDKSKSAAFNYKVQIKAGTLTPRIAEPEKTLYFGNMGKYTEEEKSRTVFYNGKIKVKIICFIPDLMEKIIELLPTFFLVHNFGTRQSKGFGGFHMNMKKDEILGKFQEFSRLKKVPVYYIEYRERDELFKDIATIYSLLKSGHNNTGTKNGSGYFKSYLTRYFLARGIGGDKRFAKETKLACSLMRPEIKALKDRNPAKPVTEYRYIRALLGASEGVGYGTRFNDKYMPTARETVEYSSNVIKRIPSPILFKVIDSTLYIVAFSPSEKIYGQEFTFKTRSKSEKIRIPDRNQFDMEEMMDGFTKELNEEQLRERIKKGLRGSRIFAQNDYPIRKVGGENR